MGELTVFLISFAVVLALGMNRAPLWAWATGTAAIVLAWQAGVPSGQFSPQFPSLIGLLAWIVP
ncbi:MAG: hypothetical protein AAF709_25285, partial [Pseudomonadota bacterium]